MAAAAAILIAALVAHHSVLPFDGATVTRIEGTVVQILWQNPHTLIAVDVDAARWTIESEGSTALQRLGWTRDALKTGDTVIVIGARAKDGRRFMRCKTISRGGQDLRCFGSPS